MDKRVSWNQYFMEMAELVKTRSTCLSRQVGAVLIRNKRVIATGYNGAPVGTTHCSELGHCTRRKEGYSSGKGLERCRAAHAESNTIDHCARSGTSTEGSTLYVTLQPCVFCAIRLINAGVKEIVFKGEYPTELAMQLLNEAEVELIKYQRDV